MAISRCCKVRRFCRRGGQLESASAVVFSTLPRLVRPPPPAMPTPEPSKPKKRLHQKSAVQAAVVGAVLTVGLGTTAQLIYLSGASAPERAASPPGEPTPTPGAASVPVAAAPSPQPSGPSASASASPPRGSAEPGVAERRPNPPKPVALPGPAPDQLLELRELNPLTFQSLGATVSLEFRETLGSHYAELTVSTPGRPPIRCAVRSPGARCDFQAGDTSAAVDVLAVDRAQRMAQIILRSKTPH